ncbi:DNA-binding protein [Pueraria virus A]|uniref:DNA-binding protein n=1 Tax=Pueraria virus A TaxID=2920400 RepID=A0A8T9E8H7_9VIRU|nr:DNA-binding protein [Pueraria virus A]
MSGKIDKVYEEMLRMEERFAKLEMDQQKHFQEALDKASAAILAELRKEIRNKQEEPGEVIPSITKAELTQALEGLLGQIKEEAQKCHCNKEILEAIKAQDPAKDKGKEVMIPPKTKPKHSAWYPENLVLPYNPFTGKPEK